MTSVPGQARVITQPTEAAIAALVEVVATARWPGGTLLLELDDTVLREHLAPELAAAILAAISKGVAHSTSSSISSPTHHEQERPC